MFKNFLTLQYAPFPIALTTYSITTGPAMSGSSEESDVIWNLNQQLIGINFPYMHQSLDGFEKQHTPKVILIL